jgi:hypothetical protein
VTFVPQQQYIRKITAGEQNTNLRVLCASAVKAFAFALLSLTLINSNARAEPAAITPAAHIQSELTQPTLSGAGTYRWFGLAIYDARLWLGKEPLNVDDIATTRFALDLQYARSLDGSKIADASIDEMQKLKMGSKQQHKTWLAQMKIAFPDVNKGDHITGVNLPKEGARFYFNGKLTSEIKDPAFAQAFFSIWLDKNTSATDLRRKLVGGSTSATPQQ